MLGADGSRNRTKGGSDGWSEVERSPPQKHFRGGSGGPWALAQIMVKRVSVSRKFSICINNYVFLKHDGLVLKALEVFFGNQAGALSLRSLPRCSFLPPSIAQRTKPSKAITSPLTRRCGTNCSQHDNATAMEETHDEAFQEKQLAWELADLVLARDTLSLVSLQLDPG